MREPIFAIRKDCFLLRIITFCDFQKVPSTHIDNIFVFVEYVRAIEIQIFKQY